MSPDSGYCQPYLAANACSVRQSEAEKWQSQPPFGSETGPFGSETAAEPLTATLPTPLRGGSGSGSTRDGCDDDGWLWTETGLMPCPRHRLDDHDRWAAGHHRPTGATTHTGPLADTDITTGRAGLARARAALPTTRKAEP